MKKLTIRLEMSGELLNDFETIKNKLGLESGTEVFRYLVHDYRRHDCPEQKKKRYK